jgi:hypothetical protein
VVSSTNKTYRHDIAEILLKVALNTMKQTSIKVFVLRNKTNVVINQTAINISKT